MVEMVSCGTNDVADYCGNGDDDDNFDDADGDDDGDGGDDCCGNISLTLFRLSLSIHFVIFCHLSLKSQQKIIIIIKIIIIVIIILTTTLRIPQGGMLINSPFHRILQNKFLTDANSFFNLNSTIVLLYFFF